MKQITPMEVGLAVIDLDNMVAFYEDVLSCTEVRRADIAPELSHAIRTAPKGYVSVWLQTPGGEVIKLMKAPQPPERVTSEYSVERTGFAYLTFYCEDLDAALDAAKARGAVVRSEDWPMSGDIGVRLVFFEDPEGNVIELVEPVS